MAFGNGYIAFNDSIDLRIVLKRKKGPARVYIALSSDLDDAAIDFYEASDGDFDGNGECQITLASASESGWIDWSFLATQPGTVCGIEIHDDTKLRYSREKKYSGSGLPPYGTVVLVKV